MPVVDHSHLIIISTDKLLSSFLLNKASHINHLLSQQYLKYHEQPSYTNLLKQVSTSGIGVALVNLVNNSEDEKCRGTATEELSQLILFLVRNTEFYHKEKEVKHLTKSIICDCITKQTRKSPEEKPIIPSPILEFLLWFCSEEEGTNVHSQQVVTAILQELNLSDMFEEYRADLRIDCESLGR